MAAWNSIFTLLPDDREIVWCRFNGFFDDPCLAIYDSSTQLFCSVDTLIVAPVYLCYRWKSQVPAIYSGIGDLVIGSTFKIL